MSKPRILIYLLRRDIRLGDNPIFNEIAKSSHHNFTHLLPLYVFSAKQIEVSGFLSSEDGRSPFPEARSRIGGFWRCGPHRAKFLAEGLLDLKKALQDVGCGLVLRAGLTGQTVAEMIEHYKQETDRGEVVSVWMTSEEGTEEKQEENDVRRAVEKAGKGFKLWKDEKYFVDDRDLPFQTAAGLSDVFTSYRKSVEPLRRAPRATLPKPAHLLPLPNYLPPQSGPFHMPESDEEIMTSLLKPLKLDTGLSQPPEWPSDCKSAHPFLGGETQAHHRVKHLIESGSMTKYKDTRNGLLGEDFSTKLSAWLALGNITAREVHRYLLDFEDGNTKIGSSASGYGNGENAGTNWVRFELLWRDYMRLCTRKFGHRLFRLEGFRDDHSFTWKTPSKDAETKHAFTRFIEGRTGTGLIDASMRELYLTGYTSNRARQNVASFLAKHIKIDWRLGAEWYESMLTDYDVSSNWGNWQYTAGVGNDPRGEARVFNPVKQAYDYDPRGAYVKAWVPELRGISDLQCIFQPWKVPVAQRKELKLDGLEWIEHPLKKIDFRTDRSGGGRGNGNHGGASGGQSYRRQEDGNGGRGRGRGGRFGGRGQGRMGLVDREFGAAEY